MATWKVRISGKQKSTLDVDLLLAAVMALGRQLQEEEQQRRAREAKRAQRTAKPNDAESTAAIDGATRTWEDS